MNSKTLESRLEIYEVALTEFLLAKEAGIVTYDYYYHCFCWYFFFKMRINVWTIRYEKHLKFSDALPELWETRPKHYITVWFDFGDLNPRIACLKRAIKITENKIKKQEKTLAE